MDFLIENISSTPTTYVTLLGIVLLDDFVPFAPGDTAMIAAGILAANDELNLGLVIAAGAIGGFLGDNLVFLLGRKVGPRLARCLVRGERALERYRWAEDQISTRGATIIIVGRFIPAGRSATTFACGTAGFP